MEKLANAAREAAITCNELGKALWQLPRKDNSDRAIWIILSVGLILAIAEIIWFIISKL